MRRDALYEIQEERERSQWRRKRYNANASGRAFISVEYTIHLTLVMYIPSAARVHCESASASACVRVAEESAKQCPTTPSPLYRRLPSSHLSRCRCAAIACSLCTKEGSAAPPRAPHRRAAHVRSAERRAAAAEWAAPPSASPLLCLFSLSLSLSVRSRRGNMRADAEHREHTENTQKGERGDRNEKREVCRRSMPDY